MIFGVSFFNNNARKPGALEEGTPADARHTVGDCHARKPGAITEGIRRNEFYIVSYIYCCKIGTTFEYRITIQTHACAFGCVPIDRRKPGATIEGTPADARHAFWDCYARKPIAIKKATNRNSLYRVSKDNGF